MNAPLATLREWDALPAAEQHARLAALSPQHRARVQALTREVRDSRRAHPLAWAELWHREGRVEDPSVPGGWRDRTSQRTAVRQCLESGVLTAFILGGNRSGKSEAGAMLCLAFALGRDDPDVIAWAAANGLDVSAIPLGPGDVWDVSLKHADSRRYVRKKYDYLVPDGRWRNRHADDEAELTLSGGGKVIFKAVAQGCDGFQGDNVRLIRFDEEPKDASVVAEAMMRTVDDDGRIIYTMTPLSGWTKLLTDHAAHPAHDTRVVSLHGADNPYLPAGALDRRLARYGANARAARARGEITAMEGRVYSSFSRQLHVRRITDLSPDWPRFQAIDWGTSVPTAMGHAIWIPHLSTIYLRREFYRAHTTMRDRAAAMRCLELGPRHPDVIAWAAAHQVDLSGMPDWEPDAVVEMRWADPEDASTNTTMVREYDIPIRSAYKAVKYGIDVVDFFLSPDVNGAVHLIIDPDCVETLREIDGYVWSDDKDKPKVGPDDHAMDLLRYLCVGVSKLFGLGPREE